MPNNDDRPELFRRMDLNNSLRYAAGKLSPGKENRLLLVMTLRIIVPEGGFSDVPVSISRALALMEHEDLKSAASSEELIGYRIRFFSGPELPDPVISIDGVVLAGFKLIKKTNDETGEETIWLEFQATLDYTDKGDNTLVWFCRNCGYVVFWEAGKPQKTLAFADGGKESSTPQKPAQRPDTSAIARDFVAKTQKSLRRDGSSVTLTGPDGHGVEITKDTVQAV